MTAETKQGIIFNRMEKELNIFKNSIFCKSKKTIENNNYEYFVKKCIVDCFDLFSFNIKILNNLMDKDTPLQYLYDTYLADCEVNVLFFFKDYINKTGEIKDG
jgi:hypothetical protein